MMKLAYASFSLTGPRESNQDKLLEPVATPNGTYVCAIADGVGGSEGGLEAAEIAITAAADSNGTLSGTESIFALSTSRMKSFVSHNNQYERMATTLSVCLIYDYKISVLHVGDTRIYHVRSLGLNDLTQDQTEIAELQRRGILTKYQASRYRRKNTLTSALSPKEKFEIYRQEAVLKTNDRIILLTDGAYNKIHRGKIVELSLENKDITKFCNAVKTHVEENNPDDNYSCVAIEII